MTHTIRMELVKEVSTELLDDVLVAAFDGRYGGCWYWAKPTGQGWIIQDCGTDKQTWMGVEITWEDREADGLGSVVVDHAVLVQGMQRMLEATDLRKSIRETLEMALMQDDAGDLDADISDLIVQYGLFGEGVYA